MEVRARSPVLHDPARIEVRNLSKSFVSEGGEVILALKDVTIDIRKGEFLSLLGPSGCGKSTILRIVSGLDRPTSGAVLVNGREMTATPPGLGIVFQRDVLLDWRTILDNVLLPVEFAGLRRRDYVGMARELLALYGLQGFEERYPWELSGGMRQRASICRALVLDPAFLIMDEPFGALDALTRDELNLELQALWLRTRKSVLFVTHGISEAVFLSDRVVVMSPRPGRVVETVVIDLPRPREFSVRTMPKFGEYTEHIRSIFEQNGVFGRPVA